MVFPKGLIRTRYRRDCSLRRTSTVAQSASTCLKTCWVMRIAQTLRLRSSRVIAARCHRPTAKLPAPCSFFQRERWRYTEIVLLPLWRFCQICAYYACFAPSCTANDTFIVKENQLSCTSSMYLTKDTLLRDRKRRKIAQHLTGIEPMA